MKRQLRNCIVLLVLIVGLQQIGYWLGTYQSTFKAQKEIMVREDIDPSVFFYTESKQALQAEKKIRKDLMLHQKAVSIQDQ